MEKIKAQISNWNGIAYKIPRGLLPECKEFESLKQSGVYFLFGYKNVYVGQAEVRKSGKGIYQRIVDHEVDKYKDVWDEVVIFTTKDNSLGRTDISYLENRFYNKALQAEWYTVQNGNEPTIGTVTEEKESKLEEFIDQAELVLGALGYKVFEPLTEMERKKKGSDEHSQKKADIKVPELPDYSMDVGVFIHTAMRNLSEAGYIFSEKQLAECLDKGESKRIFNINYPFLKVFNEEENPHHIKGIGRFYSPFNRGKNLGICETLNPL